jgi:hypothetical protein
MYAPSAAILIALGIERSRFHISIPIFIMSFLGILFSIMYVFIKITFT